MYLCPCVCVCVRCHVLRATCGSPCSFGICEFLKSNGIDGTSHKTDNEIKITYKHTQICQSVCMYVCMHVLIRVDLRQNEQECENKAALAFTKVCISLVCIVIVFIIIVFVLVYKTQIAPSGGTAPVPAWSSRDLKNPDTLIHKHNVHILIYVCRRTHTYILTYFTT